MRERGVAVGHALEGRSGEHFDTAPAKLSFGEPGEAGGHLLHDPLLRLDEHPAHPLGAAARVELDRLRGEVLELGESLDAGVAGADEDEGEVLGTALGMLERLGDVEAFEHLVAQGGGIREGLEADSVLGETGNGKRA